MPRQLLPLLPQSTQLPAPFSALIEPLPYTFLHGDGGAVPASKISTCVFSRLNGGGGGSRTRVRNRSAWDIYVRSHLGCSRQPPPEVAKKRPASPVIFASGLRADPGAIPLCVAHPGPRGKKDPVDGLPKQPALTVSWRLLLVPPV